VTTPLEGSGLNYGRPHPDHALRYEIADEYLEVAQGLWDSWDDDAIVRNRETGQFFVKEKLHTLNHKGRFFQVAGPLNIGRSPQGQPVIFQAGSSDDGIRLAGKYADAVFTNSPSLEDTRIFARQVKASAVAHGRSRDDVKISPGISPIVGETAEEAEAKYQRIRDLISIDEALAFLGRFFDHHDFAQYDVDRPFPDLGDIGKNSFRSTTDRIKRVAKEKGQTLREVALAVATPRESFIGDGKTIADTIVAWIDAGAADGFILGFSVVAEGLDDFVRYVLPELEKRGRYSRTLPGRTLRDHLGLTRKESRYAAKPVVSFVKDRA
jgi:FMN-dependent oxidoreductase (nitrilotriacetate monooxygenase family)